MKLFLDANILVTVLNKEYPLFSYASRIIGLMDQEKFKIFTSPICLAIAFYFAEKKSGAKLAGRKIALLSSKIQIASVNSATVVKTVANKSILDFEDGLEYYSAVEAGCDFIITEDREDFYFSDIQVMDSRSFLEKHLLR